MFGLGSRNTPAPETPNPADRRLELGFLGKVIEHDDFIAHNAKFREVQELEQCIKQWYLAHHRQGHNPQHAYKGYGFVMTGGHDRQGISGRFFSSADAHGRAYPLIYFTRWAMASLYFRPAVLHHASNAVFSRLTPALAHAIQPPDQTQLDALRQPFTDEELIPENPVVDAMGDLAKLSLGEWVQAVAGPREHWQPFLQTAAADIRRYGQQKKEGADCLLTLALGSGHIAHSSLMFWLHIMESIMAGSSWRPDILWDLHSDQQFLYILSKPLTVYQFSKVLDAKLPTKKDNQTQQGVAACVQSRRLVELVLKDATKSLLDVAILWSRV